MFKLMGKKITAILRSFFTLLISGQKRQAYMTEVQRLKETGKLDPPGQEGPKGSLTINDIRLPLKKDFVTKIGTASGF